MPGKPGIRDGDLWFANNAVYGGIHNPDQMVAMPVFYKGELIAWTAALVHTTETGAVEPGGMPVSGPPPASRKAEFPADQDRRELPAARGHRRPVRGVRHPCAADDRGRPQGTLHDGGPGEDPANRAVRARRASTTSRGCSARC